MVVNVHFSSKGGSDPTYGLNQPPKDGTIAARTEQAKAVRAIIRNLPTNLERSVLVVGDFNSFWNEEPMEVFTAGAPTMTNLAMVNPAVERLSYVFEGNSQSLDHVVALLAPGQTAELKTLHVNSVLPESRQTSDHDPKYIRLRVR